jgi:Tfp pilus assembly protein PilX
MNNIMSRFIFIKKNQGVALLLTILLMSLILFLSLYLLTFTLTEDRIAKSQSWGAKTYYLAEAGIQEMVWKLKNDASYKNSFETNPSWNISFTRVNPFGAENGSYTVSILNSALAHGVITSTGTIDLGNGKTSQRIVKTYVYRAMGQSGVSTNCGYADGNIDISASVVNFRDGSAHSNNNFIINGLSTVNVDDDLNVVNQYNKSWLSTVNVGGVIHSADNPPAASPITMPAVDFDSADPSSLKNRATIVYSQNQFDTLMQNNQNLTLAGPITYVDGDVDLKGAQNITVNGLLVIGRDLIIGHSLCRGWRCGSNSITVNHTVGQASGIIAKRKINFEFWTANIDINGAVYANDQLNLLSFPIGFDFDVVGGLIARKLTFTSIWQPININYNNTILTEALGSSNFSPVLTVEHWEEEY